MMKERAGMDINYWDCEYKAYDEYWDGENEWRDYGCIHPMREVNTCLLDNKYGLDKDNCILLDK